MDVNLATYSALVALELAATDSSSMRRSRSSAGFEPMGVKTSRLSGLRGVDVSTCDAIFLTAACALRKEDTSAGVTPT